MQILVINSGSSSLKFRLIKLKKDLELIAKGHIDGIKLKSCKFTFTSNEKHIGQHLKANTHKQAMKIALKTLLKSKAIESYKEIDAVGHRVVHGGEKYTKPTKIDARVIKEIEKLCELAPLHNPPNLECIKTCKEVLKKIPQIAVFDTSFHQTMPEKAYMYGLPYKWYEKHGIRRYGFHGTSHKYVTNETLKLLKKKKAKIITCHIGNGSSITASLNGKSIDTSMGFTPLEGIIMGTRCGSIDPAIIPHLEEQLKMKPEEIEEILNKESGLKGLSKISPDMRDIYEKSKKKDKLAILAIEVLSYQIAKYCGAYTAALDGLDALVFTGGLGDKAFYVRKKVCDYLKFLGLKLNTKKNENCEEQIHDAKSKIKVFVITTNEEKQIALETKKIFKK